MAQPVLQVDFLAGADGSDTWHTVTAAKFNFEDFKQRPDMYIKLLRQCAESTLSEGTEFKRLCYQDDDGDWCTLNEGMFEDALRFAGEVDAGYHSLQLRIIAEKQSAPKKPTPPQASSSSSSSSCAVTAPCLGDKIEVLLQTQDPSGKWVEVDGFTVDAGDALNMQDAFMAELERRAAAVHPSGCQSLKYVDEDGDWCILCKASLADAFCLSHPVEQRLDLRRLSLRLHPKPAGAAPAAAPAATPPAREAEAGRHEDVLLRELNKFAVDVDMRKLVPKLAAAALQIVVDSQLPELFPLLDMLVALRDGDLKAESVPTMLPQAVATVLEVPAEIRKELLSRFRVAAETAVDEVRAEQAQEKPAPVEVHVNVICDGCEMSPLIGARYKSLEHGDYDLCQACYDKEQRDSSRWVRVRSEVLGDVVGSYYGAGVEKQRVHWNIACDGCGMDPIRGSRFKALDINNYDLCETCMERSAAILEQAGHRFEEVAEDAVAGAAVGGVEAAEAKKRDAQPEEEPSDSPAGASSVDDAAVAEALAAIETLSADDLKRMVTSLLQHKDSAVRAAVASTLPFHAPILSALQPSADMDERPPEDQASEQAPTDGSWDLTPEEALEEEAAKLDAPVPETVQEHAKPEPAAQPSAKVVGVAPLIVGIEVQEDVGARGDISAELAAVLASAGASQAFRIGRVGVPTSTCTGDVPVCAKVVVKNDGAVPWPDTACLALVAGESWGFEHLPLGPLRPGRACGDRHGPHACAEGAAGHYALYLGDHGRGVRGVVGPALDP
eukprot:CAMPEP_0170241586 /NCGR_PEP_ID=MMETSP0116_2-20130129/20563_1 /TAXON_ID=400756 /ORGANISM="Durinskia baltica, Strain CSIRO CS-38" /LENGTH=780 /DNA_ID=CAMNT_0010492429 /DNA_START=1 /DNA_END=2344 /DNA_ORIENTATION=-